MLNTTEKNHEVKPFLSTEFEPEKVKFRSLSNNMNAGNINDTPKGAVLVTEEIPMENWKNQLKPNKLGYVIIQKNELHKDIISYDPETKMAIVSNRNRTNPENLFSISIKGSKIFQVIERCM